MQMVNFSEFKASTDWQITSPATGKLIGVMEETSLEEIPRFYANARKAFTTWSTLSIQERLTYMRKLRLLMVNEMEKISEVISISAGKVKYEALTADLMPVLDALEYIEKQAAKILNRRSVPTPLFLMGKKSYIDYIPRGVVLVISPWNYPFQLAVIPMLSALVSGNTVILKPSEITPLVGKLIQDLCITAGFPEGVIQVAHGDKKLGAALTSGKPDYIFFTGSVHTGKIIQNVAAQDLIPTTLELGGKDPMIVFADTNMERAVNGALWGAFTNSGQVCMSVERLYVERKIYDEFTTRLAAKITKLCQGTNEDDDLGSMTFPMQCQVVKEHVEKAIAQGAKLLTGVTPDKWQLSKGLFIPPMLLVNVTQDMDIVREETFGPILPVIPFDTKEEVVLLANDSNFGLNASVWSADLKKAEWVATKLVSGAVVINDVIVSVTNPHLPFGGTKHSGIGRYHAEIGLRSFCHEKAFVVDAGKKMKELAWYPYVGKYQNVKELFIGYFGEKRNWWKIISAFLKVMKK